MKFIFSFLLLFSGTFLYAQTDSIAASKASQYVGKTIKVCDRIHEARLKNQAKDEMNVLYTGTDYDHRTFALVFPKSVLMRFKYNPNLKMINHMFCAKGKIVMYEGKPAMWIRHQSQLTVAE